MFNLHVIVGYCAAPEVRYTKTNNKPVADLRVATTEVSIVEGKREEYTEWHTVKLWGRLAEVVRDHVAKGQLVLITGRHESNKYTDKDGVERVASYITADTLRMLGGKPDHKTETNEG